MPKRKITQRQQRQIRAAQAKKRVRAETTQQPEVTNTPLGPEQHGLLVAHYGKYVDVETKNGNIYRCNLRQNIGALVIGDHVVWRAGQAKNGVVVACQPRQSLLAKPNSTGELKPIAANLDQLIIVIALVPQPTPLLLDSYLVAAEANHFHPLILCNKTDLGDLPKLLSVYQDIGYQTLAASTISAHGLDSLKQTLNAHTTVFVGQSGVGKSSLIKVLLPQESIMIGDLHQTTGLGTHTTTTARLYHLPDGGHVIDAPGIREFGLSHLNHAQIARNFIEFRPYLGQCKFRDCKHVNEPDCAILEALAQRKLTQSRLDSYWKMLA